MKSVDVKGLVIATHFVKNFKSEQAFHVLKVPCERTAWLNTGRMVTNALNSVLLVKQTNKHRVIGVYLLYLAAALIA